MDRSSFLPHQLRRLAFFSFLTLSVGLLLTSFNPWVTAQAGWRGEIKEGETLSSSLSINNHCTARHTFRVASKLKNLSFSDPTGSLFIEPRGAKSIAAVFDASGLKSKLYRGKVDIECLDCKEEPGCTQDHDELAVEMNVINAVAPVAASNARLSSAAQSSTNPLLTLNKHHEPNPGTGTWQIGVPITYVIEVGNSGAANSHITVADTLPPGFVQVAATCQATLGASCPNNNPTLAAPPFGEFSIPNGGKIEIRINGYFTTTGSKPNVAVGSAKDDNGNPLQVVSDPNSTQPPNVAKDSVFVPPAGQLPNIAVTKTVTPTSTSFSTTSPFAANLHYTITVTNTTPAPVNLGSIMTLRDVLSTSTTIPLTLAVSSPVCNPSSAMCPDLPASVPNNPPAILFPYNAAGALAANDGGLFTGDSSYKIDFDVKVTHTATCGAPTVQVNNQAILDFANGAVDTNAGDNSSLASTTISTGLKPCTGGGAVPSVIKTQRDVNTGASINAATWNNTVKYRIEINNPTGAPVTLPLGDNIYKLPGTPVFTAKIVSAPTCTGCTTLTTPALASPTVHTDLQLFGLWSASATIPGLPNPQKAVIEYTVVYTPLCETDEREDWIFNHITAGSTSSQVSTSLKEADKCELRVEKVDVTPGPIIFGTPHTYKVVYKNASNTPLDLFVRDVLSIKSNRYGNFSVDSVASCTVAAGTVTLPANPNVTGANVTFQSAGWRGVRLLNEYLKFGPASTLVCQVTLTATQPKDTNAHCQGADDPQLVNSAYMDPNNFNENGASPPFAYSSVETPLPLCRNLIVTKTAQAASFGPGQPIDYTITAENIGDDPVSSFQLKDVIQLPITLVSSNPVDPCQPSTGCISNPTVSGGNTINVSYAPLLPSHQPVSFVVHAVAPQAGGSYPNLAVGSFPAGGNFYFQGDATNFLQSEENIQVLTPTLAKAFDPATVAAKETSILTFNLTNTNSDPKQTGMSFSDTLPAGLQITGVIANSCDGSVTTSTDGHTVSLTGGQLVGPNADGSGKHSCQISVKVTAADACGVFRNDKSNFSQVKNLDVSSIQAQLEVTDCSAVGTPSLAKEFKPAKIGPGGTTTLAFTITNSTGDPKQTGIFFSDTLPPGLQIVSVTSSGCGGKVVVSPDGQTVSLADGQLVGPKADGSGQHSCQILIKVKATGDCAVYRNNEKNFSEVKNLDVRGIDEQLEVSCGGETGGLTVEKIVKGAPRGFQGQFNFLVQCATSKGFYQKAVTVSWPTPGFTTLTDVPPGSQCTVTEGPPPASLPASYNWSGLPAYLPEGGVVSIGPRGSGQVTVADTLSLCNETGQVTITKIVKGLPGDYIGTFTGTLQCWTADKLVSYPVALTSPNGLSTTVGNIPLGSTCTFQETGQPPLAGDLKWNQPVYSPGFGSVTLTGECCQQITVTNEARHCCSQTDGSYSGTGHDYSPPPATESSVNYVAPRKRQTVMSRKPSGRGKVGNN